MFDGQEIDILVILKFVHIWLKIHFWFLASLSLRNFVRLFCSPLFCADVKQYPNLIKTLSFLLKSYKLKNDRTGSIMENEQNGGIMLSISRGESRMSSSRIWWLFLVLILAGTHNIGLPRPAFLMSWRRRIGKEDESLFFDGCESAGLQVEHLGSRVYCITPKDQVSGYQIELTRWITRPMPQV